MKELIGTSLVLTLAIGMMLLSLAILMRDTPLMIEGIQSYVLGK
jgi:hypothetical protein